MKTIALSLLLFVLMLIGGPSWATPSENLVKNSSFDQRQADRIQHWTVPNRAGVSIQNEGKGPYLSLRNTNPKHQVVASQTIAIDPAWHRLRITAKLRAQDLKPGVLHWQVARVAAVYLDAKGELIKYQSPPTLREDQGWVTLTVQHVIPEGAASLRLDPGLYFATGRFDVDDVTVQVIGIKQSAMKSTWGEEPVLAIGPKRGLVVLNGPWRFAPATEALYDTMPSGEQWGRAWVPGSWHRRPDWKRPGWIEAGQGQPWDTFKEARSRVAAGWYERELTIPADWHGRAVELDLWHVSTVADVFVDGKPVGQAPFGQGRVDLTPHVRAGQTHRLAIRVAAIPDAADKLFLQGENPEQIIKRTGGLSEMGLTGDVELISRPRGAHVSDVYVVTSVRKNTVTLQVELAGVQEAGPVTFVANMLNEAGDIERRFEATADARVAPVQSLRLTFDWDDARLWDVGQPNLYTLSLETQGPGGLDDDYRQRFGFREFWIEGRGFMLNGTPIRLRPSQFRASFAHLESIDRIMRDAVAMGFNLVPTDGHLSGASPSTHLAAAKADELGVMSIGWTIGMGAYAVDGSWTDPQVRARWQRRMAASMRRLRNHPSIVVWATSANTFAHGQDQNPRYLGNSKMLDVREQHPKWWERAQKGLQALNAIRQTDPTRPVYAHSGSFVGDIQVANMYLNLLPLQDREQWLSEWAQTGDRPFMAGEFGLPLNNTITRGKAGGGWISRTKGSYNSEPMLTEYAAVYLGPEAYALESERYRRWIAQAHDQGEIYPHSLKDPVNFDPGMQRLMELFISHTWRSWRTLGTTGGMVPWASNLFIAKPNTQVSFPSFVPGRRGEWVPQLPAKEFHFISQTEAKPLPAAQTLVDHNQDTLAWIAGPHDPADVASVTDKDHQFRGQHTLQKTAVLIHDGRAPAPYRSRWTVRVEDEVIAQGEDAGVINPATDVRLPIEAELPSAKARMQGTIKLEAEIGGVAHQDEFVFRVWPSQPKATPTGGLALHVMDPVGETQAMLRAMAVAYHEVNAVPSEGVLVIGRRALNSIDDLPEGLDAFVRRGGRLLVMGQTPEALSGIWGFRVSPHVSRRMFPVRADHPITAGLDAEDFRDWTGHGKLVEAKPHYAVDPAEADVPYNHDKPWHGWRWGTRGSVSSAAVEKPHRAGWRPLLEGEFDLAYSPLMELPLGQGLVVLCTLDLEDHAQLDPAAHAVAQQLLTHVTTPSPKGRTPRSLAWAGNAETRPAWETMLLVDRGDAQSNPGHAGPDRLLVLTSTQAEALAKARAHLRSGGDVLVPARRSAGEGAFGLRYLNAEIDGTRPIQADPITAGLSASETRFRVPTAWTLLDDASLDHVLVPGMLGIKRIGAGRVIAMQWDPDRFDVEAHPFQRYTRWRHTRAIAAVLSNLGVELVGDAWFLRPATRNDGRIALGGDGWRMQQTLRLDPAKNIKQSHNDPGLSAKAKRLINAPLASIGIATHMPATIDRPGTSGAGTDGEWVVARSFTLSEAAASRDYLLELGALDDFDTVFVNGQAVGSTGPDTPSFWSVPRRYPVPASVLKPGENRLTVRIFDRFGGGGMRAKDPAMLRLLDAQTATQHRGLYHPDYRNDFAYGDDPYRYYRW